MKNDFTGMIDKWPSTMVARNEIDRFTGGLISPSTMANLDSQGKGPVKIKLGKKIAYPVEPFVEWLNRRIEGES